MFANREAFIKELTVHQAKLEKHNADMEDYADTRTDAQITATQKLVAALQKDSKSKPEPFTRLEIKAINEDTELLNIMSKYAKLVPNEYHAAKGEHDEKIAADRQANINLNKKNPI